MKKRAYQKPEALKPVEQEFRDRIVSKILKELRKKDFVVRANFQCCLDHATQHIQYFVQAQKKAGAVYWSRLEEKQFYSGEIALYFVAASDSPDARKSAAETIITTVRKHGLKTTWDGVSNKIDVKNEVIPEYKPVLKAKEIVDEADIVLTKIQQQRAEMQKELQDLAVKEQRIAKTKDVNKAILAEAFSKYEQRIGTLGNSES